MAGTGTQNDPYIVSTWAELVERAAETDKFIKVNNDIDVLLEYPDGDAPTLVLNGNVDGDNKTISRWYCTGSRYLITTGVSCHYIKNCIFTNIKTTYHLVSIGVPSNQDSFVVVNNCKFAGIMGDGYIFSPNVNRDTRNGTVQNVVINIKGNDLKLLYIGTGNDYPHFYNFNVKLKTNASQLLYSYYSSRYIYFNDSYIEVDGPNIELYLSGESSKKVIFDNSIVDIKTSNTLYFDSGNSLISIFNSTHAPSAQGVADKVIGVDNTHWLDADYLANTVGFNILTGD